MSRYSIYVLWAIAKHFSTMNANLLETLVGSVCINVCFLANHVVVVATVSVVTATVSFLLFLLHFFFSFGAFVCQCYRARNKHLSCLFTFYVR